MSKGRAAKVGDENVSQNGYHYVRCASGWRLKHHLVAEKKLGRPLEKDERVSFGEKGKTCFDEDNVIVTKKAINGGNYGKRLYTVEEKMTRFVEDAPDHYQALCDLRDALGDVFSLYGFSATSASAR